jgi:hypothetical protein
MLLLGYCNYVLIDVACCADCLQLAQTMPFLQHTVCPGQAIQFLAVGHKIRISFLRNAEIIQKNSDEF